MVMLWNLVVLVGFVVERGGSQKAGHPTYKCLKSLLKGTYIYKYLLLTFLLKSLIIINRFYTLFISLYKY